MYSHRAQDFTTEAQNTRRRQKEKIFLRDLRGEVENYALRKYNGKFCDGGVSLRILIDHSQPLMLWRLALPSMASSALMAGFDLVDLFWMGRLGRDAVAAISASIFCLWTAYSVSDISAYGINSYVARRVGNDNFLQANNALLLGLLIGLFFSLCATAIGLWLTPGIFRFMDLSPTVVELATQYFDTVMMGIVAMFTWRNLSAALRSAGDMRTPMRILVICLISHAIITPLLIFGGWIFPGLGIKGCGLARVITYLLACLLAIRKLITQDWSFNFLRLFQHYPLSDFWAGVRKILWVGLPVSFSSFTYSQVYVQLTPLMAQFGTAAVAGIGIGQRIEELAHFVCFGFATAVTVLVGQNMGAKRVREAEQTVWLAILNIFALLAPIIFLLVTIPEHIVALITHDQSLVQIGSGYLVALGVILIFNAIEYVMIEAFCGICQTWPLIVFEIPMTLLLLPLARFLAIHLDYGVAGIWWAVAGITVIKGLCMAAIFKLRMRRERLRMQP